MLKSYATACAALQALKDQNTRLQQDLMHARQELNASFAEALKLLTEG